MLVASRASDLITGHTDPHPGALSQGVYLGVIVKWSYWVSAVASLLDGADTDASWERCQAASDHNAASIDAQISHPCP